MQGLNGVGQSDHPERSPQPRPIPLILHPKYFGRQYPQSSMVYWVRGSLATPTQLAAVSNGLWVHLMKGQKVGEEGEGMCCIPKYQREFGICERLFYAF